MAFAEAHRASGDAVACMREKWDRTKRGSIGEHFEVRSQESEVRRKTALACFHGGGSPPPTMKDENRSNFTADCLLPTADYFHDK
jgi:hypothetical protein